MARKILNVTVLVLLAAVLVLPSISSAEEKMMEKESMMKASDLSLALRDLWVSHIFWVRNVVQTTKSGNADAANVAEEKVVENAREIADSIVPFYGKEAADKLFVLLANHYRAIKEYMNASFNANMEAKKTAADKLKKNADEIASFLNSANFNWPVETLSSALLAHVGHHMAQIDAIGEKDYYAEAKTWKAMKDHIYVIADVLASGIAKQFPQKVMM